MKSPAFQVYPADFLADKNTLVMSTTEIGAYWLLLLVCWQENGLPESVEDLADIARLPLKQFQPLWERRIEKCFIRRADQSLTHKRLEKERVKQAENREKRQRAGTKGANARWQPHGNAITENGSGQDSVMAPDGLSDFSLQVSTSEEERQQRTTRAPSAAQGTRLPENFSLSPVLKQWARENAPGVDLEKTLAEFHDYWRGVPGARGRKLDWPATFRNRVRELAGRKNGSYAVQQEHPNAHRPGKIIT